MNLNNDNPKISFSVQKQSHRGLLSFPAVSYVIIATLFLAVFFDPISTVVMGWTRRAQSYGALIFTIGLYMLWARRSTLQRMSIHAEPMWGGLVTALGCGMLFLGKIGNMVVLQEMSIIVTILGLVWALWGHSLLRGVLFPLSYLVFMFPFLPALLGKYSFFFQTSSAYIASKVLLIGGMPVIREGEVITLPHVVLDVVKDCSGINHIIALMAISMPLAYFTLRSRWAKAGLIISSFFIGIFSNSMRIALIGLWTRFRPDTDIHGPQSLLVTSWFIMGFGLVLIVLVQLVFLKIGNRGGVAKSPVHRLAEKTISETSSERNPLPVVIVLLLATGLLTHSIEPRSESIARPIDVLPSCIGEWMGHDVNELNEPFENQNANKVLKRIYRTSAGRAAKLYIGFYSVQTQEREIFNRSNEILEANAVLISLPVDSTEQKKVLRTRYRNGGGWSEAYYWYLVDGRVITNRYHLKLALIRNMLANRSNSAAIVVVSRTGTINPPVDDKADFLQNFLQPTISACSRIFSR